MKEIILEIILLTQIIIIGMAVVALWVQSL